MPSTLCCIACSASSRDLALFLRSETSTELMTMPTAAPAGSSTGAAHTMKARPCRSTTSPCSGLPEVKARTAGHPGQGSSLPCRTW